ncbi:MAG: hypothetical protein GY871_04160 [Actinomycetales bacterium]|nr:hypothetical protein [Actinomycetales bacterium]
MISIGIDPGLTGGIVVLDGGRHPVLSFRTPTEKRASKTHYRLQEMRDILDQARTLGLEDGPLLAILERTQARGAIKIKGRKVRMSGASMHSMGLGSGLWMGLLAAMQIPFETVLPSVWMKKMLHSVPGEGKERSIAVCEQYLPTLDLKPGRCTKPHDGIADAAVLAIYGLRQMRGAL